MDANRCVCCGEIIVEDRQVCPQCEYKYTHSEKDAYKKERKDNDKN